MYTFFIRPILFLFDPEFIHRIVFSLLTITGKLPGFRSLITWCFECKNTCLERQLWGLRFKNPVGLAAGFDKNGKWIDTLQGFGFGFIEIGTITPRPQKGNPTPRLFRLPQDHALINRMGFNNLGAQAVADGLAQHQQARGEQRGLLIGGNIGKNKDTPNEQAISDYAFCFEVLYRYVDYFVVNVSSPNTPGLRALQNKGPLRELLTHIKKISDAKDTPKPILLKIAPDLSPEQLEDIVDIIKDTKIDGVVATNTTTSRDHMVSPPTTIKRAGEGGLSGQPLTQRATEVIRYLRQNLGINFPIIGVGGIMSPQDALDKIHAGADLIQLYTGFLYEGPALIKRINKAIQKHSPTQP